MVFDPALEHRLYEWGGWCVDLKNGNIGYPRESPMVAIIEVGIFCPNFGPREPRLNDRAMEIARWVRRLSLEFPDYATALQDYYFNPKMPLRVLAEARGISIRTLKARVFSGKVWLSGRISADEE